jgi:membrane associated rhomboid family serine protease
VIPLKDQNPTRRPAVLTYALIAANLIIYFYLAQHPVMDLRVIERYAVVPAFISHGQHLGTLITAQFLHANLLHVGGNMLFLWIFGNNVEDRLGPIKFLVLYFLSGIVGSLVQVFTDPTSTIPELGASGAISGVLAAYVLYFPRARVLTYIAPFFFVYLSAFIVIGLWIALQAFQAFMNIGVESGGVAFFAHLGGFVTGLIVAVLFRPREPAAPQAYRV